MIIKLEPNEQFYATIIDTFRTGGVVGLPTDTIYGLAVDGTNKDAVEKLSRLKQRAGKPYTFFISKNNLAKYALIVKQKIIGYFVPGPLTIILKKNPETTLYCTEENIGIRIPQTDYILKLLTMYQLPLAVTSANISGEGTLISAPDIADKFTDIDLVIDGGTVKGEPSTILDLTTTPPTVRRKGKIAILEIEKIYGRRLLLTPSLKFNLLFVCTGNSCRSPLAEGIFRTMVDQRHVEVRSAGTNTVNGLAASDFAQKVVAEFGGTITDHVTKEITLDLIRWADLILVMGYKQYQTVLEFMPDAAAKTFLLKEYKRRSKYNEVSDPVGKDLAAYRDCALGMYPSLKFVARDIEKRFRP